jgi:hypothetical protein
MLNGEQRDRRLAAVEARLARVEKGYDAYGFGD